MTRLLQHPLFKTMFPIGIGTAIYAFGLHYFIIPNQFMEGGITGVTLLLRYAFGIQPSYSTLALNIPLFLIGWKMLGSKSMIYTIAGTLFLTLFLWIMEQIIGLGWVEPFRTESDPMLAALYAGITLGSGLGIVFRYGGTTGGSDIIARIGSRIWGWSMGRVILTIDVIVIGLSLIYIPQEKVLYTLVAVFITSRLIDFIQEGAYAARAFTIITNRGKQVAEAVTNSMERSATLMNATGAYSNAPKQIVYCVVYRTEMRQLSQIVRSIDPHAFIIISEVYDVLGEGFKEE
jgi:uncharacterized membrane-anchored protein YitT (DUF2179 family)